MKISLAQMDVKLGQPQKNVERMIKFIQEAYDDGSDIVVFPELCVGGMFLSDEYNNESFCKELMSYNEVLRKASKDIVIIYGNICLGDKSSRNRDGRRRKFNCGYILQDGHSVDNTIGWTVNATPKSLLPCYRIFDDTRYFASLSDSASADGVDLNNVHSPIVLKIRGKEYKIGITLCEDLWCKDYKTDRSVLNPSKYLIKNGAEIIFNLSASPWTHEKNRARDNAVKFLYEDCKKDGLPFVPFYYVNCVGAQNTGKNIVTFDGGSTVYNCDGNVYDYIPDAYREELFTTDNAEVICDTDNMPRKSKNKIAEKYQAILTGIRHMKDILGLDKYPKFCIGLSGGIDSAVVAYCLVKAVGKKNVCSINIPTQFNSDKTKNVAEQIAQALGIEYRIMPIEDLVQKTNEILEYNGEKTLTDLMKENIQSRIRGSSIMAGIAATDMALFTNNGNKVEMALGYCTAYGDLGGSICPIGDLLKTEVFELAKYINGIEGKEIIPSILFPDDLFIFTKDKIPSGPELKENQISEIKIGYHDYIIAVFMDYQRKNPEDILEWYLNGKLEDELSKFGMKKGIIKRYDLDNKKIFIKDLEWIFRKIYQNTWKRIQAPPIIITSKTAFGTDRRESMLPFIKSQRYLELETKILNN